MNNPRKPQALDNSGKTVFDSIYLADTPAHYLAEMQALDYQIPSQAQPYFEELIKEFRARHPAGDAVRLLDIGCSYGINGALLKRGLSLKEMFGHYLNSDYQSLNPAEQQVADREWLNDHPALASLEITGLDVSAPALHYASEQHLIDAEVLADLETMPANEVQRNLLAQQDCLISTGCLGYVTEKTLATILDCCLPKRPWMTHCILRMFSTEPYRELLESRGYQVWQPDILLPQRRFSSAQEQAQVIASLRQRGIETEGFESQGWLLAQILIAIPDNVDWQPLA